MAGDPQAAAAFPWDDVLAFGLGVLKLSPRDFWAATPRELAAAMGAFGGRSGARAPSPADLLALMTRFPDQP
ncbi:phage tail assembly chaperone [Fulvimarina endophytica]|uniref:Phage tail assembly chaperone n=1 Tax=Fulvimarina endophytica TaxID=2293836 RepID=A0A371X4Q8_9HYPH|nr:phage tail assembly chaperone [Fulvimarina endophytica]RFC64226.1 phage tail assembly chaperone [Fulvimarina endophytica]